jgi:hypothetical protein
VTPCARRFGPARVIAHFRMERARPGRLDWRSARLGLDPAARSLGSIARFDRSARLGLALGPLGSIRRLGSTRLDTRGITRGPPSPRRHPPLLTM